MSSDNGGSDESSFQDELGQNVINMFQNLENGLEKLMHNLENQFEDSQYIEEASNVSVNLKGDILTQKPINNEILINKTEEGMDEIIDLLNSDQSSEENDQQQQENFTNGHISSTLSGIEKNHQMSPILRGEYRIFELINALLSRPDYDEDEYDEWDHDDDAGYISISLTDEEFYAYEEKNAETLYSANTSGNDVTAESNKILSESFESPTRSNLKMYNGTEQLFDDSIHKSSRNSEKLKQQKQIISDFITENLSDINEDDEYQSIHSDPFLLKPTDASLRRQSVSERRRSEIIGQHRFQGVDGDLHCFFQLKVIFEPYRTGFEEQKDFQPPKGTIIAGRYEVYDILGQAAFSTALQCYDLAADEDKQDSNWVCLKVIKNNKDFFDQSLDEIKLLQYINSHGDPDSHHILRLIDFFYYKEHLFIVSELLKENLYEFGRYITENQLEVYYTLPRLKRIAKQILEALQFIHQLKLIHCDVKPENIVIKSFSRCEVKLIDFGSSCFTTDHLTTYIQSRSYRAPEVILGHKYDSRIDIWSVGAVLAELYTGYVLFQNDSVPTMLSRITGILGTFPPEVLLRCREANKYFTLNNIVYEKDVTDPAGTQFHLIFPKKTNLRKRLHLDSLSMQQHHVTPAPRKMSSNRTGETLETTDEELFVDFVQELLNLNPENRYSAKQALRHPWLEDADTVEFKEYIIGQPAAPVPVEEATNNEGSADHSSSSQDDAIFYTGYDDGDEEEDCEVDDFSANRSITIDEEFAAYEENQNAKLQDVGEDTTEDNADK